MTPGKAPKLSIPEYRAEVEHLFREVKSLADHPDERIAALAQRVHWLESVRPRGA